MNAMALLFDFQPISRHFHRFLRQEEQYRYFENPSRCPICSGALREQPRLEVFLTSRSGFSWRGSSFRASTYYMRSAGYIKSTLLG